MKDNNTIEKESLSKEEIIKIKKDADELLSAFNYNPYALNLDIINMKDFYCRGYAKRFKEDKVVIDKLIEDNALLLEALKNLVQLKKCKDKNGKDEHYVKSQPIAWKNAKEAIKKATSK